MNQIEYSISLQRILAISGGIAFFCLCLALIFTSPLDNSNYIWLMLTLIWFILTVIFSLIGYWWVFSIKKQIISILHSNLIVSKSSFISLSLVYLLVSYLSQNLNILVVSSIIGINIVFYFFIRTYNF